MGSSLGSQFRLMGQNKRPNAQAEVNMRLGNGRENITNSSFNMDLETSLVAQWLRICLSVQVKWVQSLVLELRSHVPCMWQPSPRAAKKNQQRQKKKKKTTKQHRNGFNEKSRYFFAIQSKLSQVQGADEQKYFAWCLLCLPL